MAGAVNFQERRTCPFIAKQWASDVWEGLTRR
jgi:hypothetical protein